MTTQEIKAINNLNKALAAIHKLGIKICGMDSDLLYATKLAIYKSKKVENKGGQYCEVANANLIDQDGVGKLKAACYQESGGW